MKIASKIYTALVYLFLFAPIFVLIFFSFNSGSSTAVFEGFSLRWYEEVFRDTATLEAFKNTDSSSQYFCSCGTFSIDFYSYRYCCGSWY